MSIELFLIGVIVMMIFESGWWNEMDDMVNRKFKFCHLPKIFVCQFCQCFWLSLVFLLITGETLILSLFWALINANISELLLPVFKLFKETFKAIIEWMINKIY